MRGARRDEPEGSWPDGGEYRFQRGDLDPELRRRRQDAAEEMK